MAAAHSLELNWPLLRNLWLTSPPPPSPRPLSTPHTQSDTPTPGPQPSCPSLTFRASCSGFNVAKLGAADSDSRNPSGHLPPRTLPPVNSVSNKNPVLHPRAVFFSRNPGLKPCHPKGSPPTHTPHHHSSSFRLLTHLAWHASCNFRCSESKVAELAAAEGAGDSDKVQQLQATIMALSSEQVRKQDDDGVAAHGGGGVAGVLCRGGLLGTCSHSASTFGASGSRPSTRGQAAPGRWDISGTECPQPPVLHPITNLCCCCCCCCCSPSASLRRPPPPRPYCVRTLTCYVPSSRMLPAGWCVKGRCMNQGACE